MPGRDSERIAVGIAGERVAAIAQGLAHFRDQSLFVDRVVANNACAGDLVVQTLGVAAIRVAEFPASRICDA